MWFCKFGWNMTQATAIIWVFRLRQGVDLNFLITKNFHFCTCEFKFYRSYWQAIFKHDFVVLRYVRRFIFYINHKYGFIDDILLQHIVRIHSSILKRVSEYLSTSYRRSVIQFAKLFNFFSLHSNLPNWSNFSLCTVICSSISSEYCNIFMRTTRRAFLFFSFCNIQNT